MIHKMRCCLETTDHQKRDTQAFTQTSSVSMQTSVYKNTSHAIAVRITLHYKTLCPQYNVHEKKLLSPYRASQMGGSRYPMEIPVERAISLHPGFR